MALPQQGFVFKIPKKYQSQFGDEKILQIENIQLNDNEKLLIKLMNPHGRELVKKMNYDEFVTILKKAPKMKYNAAKNEFLKMKKSKKHSDEKSVKQVNSNRIDPKRKLNMLAKLAMSSLKKIIQDTSKDNDENYRQRYFLNLNRLKDTFKDVQLAHFDTTLNNELDKLAARLSKSNPNQIRKTKDGNTTIYEHTFRSSGGKVLIDTEVIKQIEWKKDDFTAGGPDAFDEWSFSLANINDLKLSNYEPPKNKNMKLDSYKHVKFTYEMEARILEIMKKKQLLRYKKLISSQILDRVNIAPGSDSFKKLSDVIYAKELIESSNVGRLRALAKHFKINEDNLGRMRNKLRMIRPDNIRRVQTKQTKMQTRKTKGRTMETKGRMKRQMQVQTLVRPSRESVYSVASAGPSSRNASLSKISKISMGNLQYDNGTEVRLLIPNSGANLKENMTHLQKIVLKYAMLLAMKQRLEDKINDTREIMEFIEPYRCISEFIGSQYLDMLSDKASANYKSTLGCMSDVYGMKHMFDEQKAIIRFASGIAKTNAIDPRTFLGQVKHLSEDKKSPNQIARDWTNTFGKGVDNTGPNFAAQQKRGEHNKGFEAASMDVRELLGWTDRKLPLKKVKKKEEAFRFLPPPMKYENGTESPDGYVSKMLTNVYYNGFCHKPSEAVQCIKDDDTIANSYIDYNFWDSRLKYFARSAGINIGGDVFSSLRDQYIKEPSTLQDKRELVCPGGDCHKYCQGKSLHYCDGMQSLVSRMLNYRIPKLKMQSNRKKDDINVDFDKLIVNIAAEAKRMKRKMIKNKQPKGRGIEDIKKNINTLNTKIKQQQKILSSNTTKNIAITIPRAQIQLQQLRAERAKQMNNLKRKQNIQNARHNFTLKYVAERIDEKLNDPVGAWKEMTLIDRERVVQKSDIQDEINSQGKRVGVATLVKQGVGTIVPMLHNGREDKAIVVPLGGVPQVISHNVLQELLSGSILAHIPQEYSDIIHGGDVLYKMGRKGKEITVNDVLGVKDKKTLHTLTAGFYDVLKDINSSYRIVSERLVRRRRRKLEEISRKLKASHLSYIEHQHENSDNDDLLKYMYSKMASRMDSTKAFIKKMKRMPGRTPGNTCDYFQILHSHYYGFGFNENYKKSNAYCNSTNIHKLYKTFTTATHVHDVLQGLFSIDKKMRQVYQYSADDVHPGMVDISSCASNYVKLGKHEHAVLHTGIVNKIRDKKISREINKYKKLISILKNETKHNRNKLAKKELMLKNETDNSKKDAIRSEIRNITDKIDRNEHKLNNIIHKQDKYRRMKRSIGKGNIKYMDVNTIPTNSKQQNNLFFKHTTLLTNYIWYLISNSS